MALVKKDSHKTVDVFDQLFGLWPDWFRRPLVVWPDTTDEFLKVEQFREDGTLVVRAEIPGIDPEKDVDVTVAEGMLHIAAERRQQEQTEDGKDYLRREFRYGAFRRDLPLPEGTTPDDIKATYRDGILEIQVPLPASKTEEVTKVPVATA
jgi:HSP20 family protein